MSQSLRINAVQVIVNLDLSVSYRLTLPLKAHHAELFSDRSKIKTYVKNNKIRYQYVVESTDRVEILNQMTAAQLVIGDAKIAELQLRQSILINRLSEMK